MRLILFFSFLMILFSCDSEVYFSKSEVIGESSWAFDDVKVFDFEIKDTTVRYDLILEVDHSVDYVFENIYVKIYTSFPKGNVTEDIVSLELADKLDQWEGQCTGKRCKVGIVLQQHIFFKEAGNYSIKIEQFNRTSPLDGIEKLTLKILELKAD